MNTIPTKAEVEAAKIAARNNAEGWVEGFGCPYDEPDDCAERIANGEPMDDIHMDTIAYALGYSSQEELSDEQLLRVWPVYRAAMVLRVYELLAQEKGA